MALASGLVSSRFSPRPESYLRLTPAQERARRAVLAKIEGGGYRFLERSCQLCGSDDGTVVAERDRYSLPVRTVLCSTCGLLRTDPVMRAEDYSDFYQNHYTALYDGFQYSAGRFFDNQVYAGKRIEETASKYIDFRGRLLAEVGCAAGGILHYFRDLGARVIGCDYGTSFLEYGRSQGLDIRRGGLGEIASDRPDVLLYSHVLEHILDVNAELIQVHEILSDRGYLIIDVPGIYNIRNAYRSDLLRYFQNAHLYHFCATTLSALLARNGFETVHVDERCIGIFRKAVRKNHVATVAHGEPQRIRAHLSRLEAQLWLHRLRALPRDLVVHAMKATGLYGPLRRLIRGTGRR